MRTGLLVAIIGLVFMVIGYTLSSIGGEALLSPSLFVIGFLLNVLGILMINRDFENLLVRIEVESNKPSPDDIRKRPLRKPRR